MTKPNPGPAPDTGARPYDPSVFPAFAVTVDLAVFTLRSGQLHTLLVERGEAPHLGQLALPGGFIRPDEDAEAAARRELAEETQVGLESPFHLEQLRTYSAVGRDPRMRVVTIAYVAFAPDLPDPVAGADAKAARWLAVDQALDAELAFDHRDILTDAVQRVRAKLEYTTVATRFLPRTFTLGELRAVYQAVWGEPVEAPNFRRKVLAAPGFVAPVGQFRVGVPGPRAQLYQAGGAESITPPFTRANARPTTR
ncbi:MAG: NUDIX domain-containing protein [Bifidobacteriaceae bacterium]|jgi:8-oxo-dGTP diphosphatase|nr:NUDIX domain-containing protein [Bifidobacteriaceae bacterium]